MLPEWQKFMYFDYKNTHFLPLNEMSDKISHKDSIKQSCKMYSYCL